MNVLSWNCRGLNNRDSPTIPHFFWLVSKYRPSLLFLQETKCSFPHVHNMLRSTNPSVVHGVDAQASRGGIVIFVRACMRLM